MRKRLSALLWGLFLSASFCALSHGATITWTNRHPDGPTPVIDSARNPVGGSFDPGPVPDLSMGSLVQLWKAVGAIDDPAHNFGAYWDLDWRINDVLLDESHIGFGAPDRCDVSWSHTGDYAVNEGDILYVRVYNVPKPDFVTIPVTGREISVRDRWNRVVYQTVGDTSSPQTLYFDYLCTGCVPEPCAALLVFPGLALWAMKKRRLIWRERLR